MRRVGRMRVALGRGERPWYANVSIPGMRFCSESIVTERLCAILVLQSYTACSK